jgi:hypothetical protein
MIKLLLSGRCRLFRDPPVDESHLKTYRSSAFEVYSKTEMESDAEWLLSAGDDLRSDGPV